MSPIEKNYTPAQVAEILQVNEVSVRRWLSAGKMSGFKLGRVWRVTESDLQAFIDEHRTHAEKSKSK